MIKRFFAGLSLTLLLLPLCSVSVAQTDSSADTLEISFPDFLALALERSNELAARQQQIGIADTRRQQARASRFLPNLELTTGHGLIPGVRPGDSDFPSSDLYLDPDLRTDWNDWAFFNQAEISAVQPLYTWGALSSAIKASKAGVRAAAAEYDDRRQGYEMDIFELYQGRLLAMELKQLTDEAQSTIRSAERELEKLIREGSDEIDDADLFQLEIFTHQFQAQVDEVDQNLAFIAHAWHLAVREQGGSRAAAPVYIPEDPFVDPLLDHPGDQQAYRQAGLRQRPEIRQLDAATEAAGYGMKAAKAQRYPAIVMGINYRYAYASNRPRQRNPFISNPSNTESLTVGLGIRQNLNFFVLESRVERARLEQRQASHARDAAMDGVELDIADKHKDAQIAYSRMQASDRAVDVSRNWLRQEQLDYDIGFGDVNNLVDAVRQNLELEAEYKQRVHDYNIALARLYKASGRSILELYDSDN